ncbi:glycosyl transferase, family 2 [[Actinomadura] parvosata subsp. kistnae]|uniref:Family 2 glycosyl transferase n=1 Tax=[Actinomadura] parvosata subsp. kistnae TaxID=1909395 RepID=A0A1V0A7Q0_9ACTN|nr:glycosyltransferase [Nonomuraea sp. ATCC 55076]AQZ66246.1 family 2 glycosyl transferase [Nonomuraea sp. ATCC 55076]SPL97763.1 glycosyl transferase, family 2 [Actinomadura parvosata subsp. kistnae]
MSVTPCGFTRTPEKGLARLHWADTGWAVDGQPLDVAALRPLRGLEIEWPDRPVPLDGLMAPAAAGVPLTADHAPPWVPDDLAALLTDRDWLGHAADGTTRSLADLRREEHSVRLRRLAHPVTAPHVSIIMATKRPALVGQALAQMERQRDVRAEVLLGLHGVWHEQVREAVASCSLPVRWAEADAAVPFGEVLNRAAALASGDYLAKWDDDDWYGPRHLADLFMAMSYSAADVVGTTAEFFYLEPLKATVRRTTFASGASYPSEVWADHVAGGTIMVSRAKFQEIGGFPGLPRAVDLEFLKAAQKAGARVYRTHGLGYVLRRGLSADHTWQLPLAHFLKVAVNQWRGFRPSLLMEAA